MHKAKVIAHYNCERYNLNDKNKRDHGEELSEIQIS